MKSICLYFQVHQSFRYRKYRFFDIGNEHDYYDNYANKAIFHKIKDNCYLPANEIILEQIQKHKGKFKVAYSISGIAMEQFTQYAPELIDSFRKLAETGCVEFLSETYPQSLVSLIDDELFENQVKQHSDKVEELFGIRPKVLRNTELIYSDDIGDRVYKMGFKGMITEGAKHILGWKSPNYLYCSAKTPRLKMLMRNHKLSDDIAFRFSNKKWTEFPLTANKFANWLLNIDNNEDIINLFLGYETFGENQPADTGILNFLSALPSAVLKNKDLSFTTPSEAIKKYQPISAIHVPHTISWADEERDLSAWLGNELQEEAFNKLYELKERMACCADPTLNSDWNYLQVSGHFYDMCTKFFSGGEQHKRFSSFTNPYEAFINYMNILSDFKIRLNALAPENETDRKIATLKTIIEQRDKKVEKTEQELKKVKVQLRNIKDAGKTKKSDTTLSMKKIPNKIKVASGKSARSGSKIVVKKRSTSTLKH